MIDWTKPIEMLDGRACRLLGEVRGRDGYTKVVAISDGPEEFIAYFNEAGKTPWGENPVLHNVPEKHERWLNCIGEHVRDVWHSRDQADRYATPDRTACIRVEWQDGEGTA